MHTARIPFRYGAARGMLASMATAKKSAAAKKATKPAAKRMGRPPRSATGSLAEKAVTLRYTPQEYAALEHAAGRVGVPVSTFIRDASLSVAKSL